MTTITAPAEKILGIGFAPREVVGYTFDAETYCPTHMIFALPTGPGGIFEGWALAEDAVVLSAENNLDEIAWAFSIDRTDEDTFDSGDFPKILRAEDVISPEEAEAFPDTGYATACATCQETLVG